MFLFSQVKRVTERVLTAQIWGSVSTAQQVMARAFFGVIENSDDRGDLGAGPGGSIRIRCLFNYSVLAVGVNLTQAY
jgi:hypothetical protein